MNTETYIELYNSFINTLIKTNPTDFTVETLEEALINTVNILKSFRLDDYATNKAITSELNKYRKQRKTPDGEIDHYEDTVDSNLLSHILLKYVKKEKSYYYAYLRLQQEENCRVALPTDIIFMNEQDIEDAVLADMRNEKKVALQKETFCDLLIHNNQESLLKQLHELLDYKKGKDVAIVIKAMEQQHLLKPYNSVRSLHSLITDEFGDIGSLKNFTNYINESSGYTLLQADIDKVITILKSI